jgi:hypothetical protein
MEFRRSFLRNIISFFFVLEMPTIRSIADAYALWSERFKLSEHKAVIQLTSQLFATEKLDFSSPKDKPKALRAIGRQIKRYEFITGAFKDIGVNSMQCARANVSLDIDLTNLKTDLKRFIDGFNDVETCRSKCRIDTFILSRHKDKVEHYVRLGEALPGNKNNLGFKKIAGNLKEILRKGSDACSCKRCEKIGDAVIALETKRNLILEHTDPSFNHLCDTIGQPHRQHPSHVKVVQLASKKTFKP